MREFVADIELTGELRPDLDTETGADVIWSMNGSEYYALLVIERGWAPRRFEAWLGDAWARLLLAPARRSER